MKIRTLSSGRGSTILAFALVLVGVMVMQPGAWAGINLPFATQPPSGLAGTTIEYVTGSGFPAGVTAADVTVHIALTCLGADVTTAAATQVTHIIGSTYRTAFKIPGTLATGTYSVWLTGAAPAFTSNNCSTLMVTNSTPKIASCIPSSSLALALGPNVTAYVPKGAWSNSTTGIGVVTIEGVGASTDIPTPNAVNACSSNAITGETVCTANNTDVYLITGTTLNTTLSSGANTRADFSGGSCFNCGVAIDAANNTAYIEEGVTGGASGQGVQALHLGTNTFDSPFAMHDQVSENIAIDPFLNYVLTP